MTKNEKPIIFNTEMVRAILDGKKTQTRRMGGLELSNKNPGLWRPHHDMSFVWRKWATLDIINIKPKYQIGDRLWVRETWTSFGGDIIYKADSICQKRQYIPENYFIHIKWKPSIFMPKKYARIWLKVLDVRVERIKDINLGDVAAEGIDASCDVATKREHRVSGGAFVELWDSINKKRGYGWDMNPWVFVYEFIIRSRDET